MNSEEILLLYLNMHVFSNYLEAELKLNTKKCRNVQTLRQNSMMTESQTRTLNRIRKSKIDPS